MENPSCTLLLPRNLAALSKCAATDVGRYSMNGVRVNRLENESGPYYRAESTDGRILARVDGAMDKPEDYPHIPALASAPNSAAVGVIPSKAWESAFKAILRKKGNKPILANVACVIGNEVATLATTDLERANVSETRLVDGRFPDTNQVFPSEPPTVSIAVNPHFLCTVLSVAAQIGEDDGRRVTIEIRVKTGRDGKPVYSPIVVRAKNDKQEFTGLVMPLT